MLRLLLNIRIWILLSASALFAGCINDAVFDDEGTEQGTQLAGNVYVRSRMTLTGDGISDSQRKAARLRGGNETPGTPRENFVAMIDLLVCDNEGTLVDVISLSRRQIELMSGEEGILIPLNVKEGQQVRIYAAVNMPDNIRSRFVEGQVGNGVSFVSNRADYWDVMDAFVPGSGGKQENLENGRRGRIPMSGQFVKADGSGDLIEATSGMTADNPLEIKADVSRIVAKVHVTAKKVTKDLSSTGETGVNYANAEARSNLPVAREGENFDNWMGWIRLDSVRYMPNGTNKSTFLFPQSLGDGNTYPKWRDLNMSLDTYVLTGKLRDMGFNASLYARDFSFYNGLALHKENISRNSHFAQVEAFEEDRLNATLSGTTADNRYTKGMYCLENYFQAPAEENAASFAGYGDAIPMVTHVSIAAKLTPKWIVVLEDYERRMDAFVHYYETAAPAFREEYGFTEKDFTDADVARWNTIKERYRDYFTGETHKYRSFRKIKLATEADAIDILNWSLMANNLWSRNPDDFERGKYPDGTFYVYDRKFDLLATSGEEAEQDNQQYLYLTAGAVLVATGEDTDIKTYSVPHLGGWGYYYTYLNETNATNAGAVPFEASQVTRNTYYLITVGNFGMPGGTISRPEYIKVNTELVGWDYEGKGDIYLH